MLTRLYKTVNMKIKLINRNRKYTPVHTSHIDKEFSSFRSPENFPDRAGLEFRDSQ